MNWRPPDWENPYKLPSTDTRRALDEREAFELGADMMLATLKKKATIISLKNDILIVILESDIKENKDG